MALKIDKIPKFDNPALEAFGHALAGATAGAFALCILYPLDQVKIRKAVQSQSRILSYRIILDDFLHFRVENLTDIYRGVHVGILQQFSFNGVYFFFDQWLKADWKRKYATAAQPEMPFLTSFFRGSIAGLLTQLLTTPLTVVQVKMQTAPSSQNATVPSIVNRIYHESGPLGFWSGMQASVILVVNPALNQIFYGKIRKYLVDRVGQSSAIIDFVAGALSKALATIICYPLLLVKMNLMAGNSNSESPSTSPHASYRHSDIQQQTIREEHEENGANEDSDESQEDNGMQTLNGAPNSNSTKKVRFSKRSIEHKLSPQRSSSQNSMSDIFSSTIREKGIMGLYCGLGPKLVHASLTNAIVLASKEKFVVHTFALMAYYAGKLKQEHTTKTKLVSA